MINLSDNRFSKIHQKLCTDAVHQYIKHEWPQHFRLQLFATWCFSIFVLKLKNYLGAMMVCLPSCYSKAVHAHLPTHCPMNERGDGVEHYISFLFSLSRFCISSLSSCNVWCHLMVSLPGWHLFASILLWCKPRSMMMMMPICSDLPRPSCGKVLLQFWCSVAVVDRYQGCIIVSFIIPSTR